MGNRTGWRARARAAIAGCAVTLVCATPALASPLGRIDDDLKNKRTKVENSIDALKGQLTETSANLSRAYLQLKETEGKLPGAQAALTTAENRLAAAEAADAQAAAELELAQAAETKAEEELARTTKDIADNQARLAQFATQIYQDQGFGQFDAALTATSPEEFATRVALVDTVMDVQGATLERLATARAAQAGTEAHLSALRKDSQAAKAKAEAAVGVANAARAAAADAKASLEALHAAQQAQAGQVKSQLAAEKDRLASMQAESDKITKQLAARAKARQIAAAKKAAEERRKAAEAKKAADAARAAAASRGGTSGTTSRSSGSSTSSGFLSSPMPGSVMTSPFGLRFHPIVGYWRLHAGQDWAAACGTPVRAAASGSVFFAGWNGGYGNSVWIDHGIERGVNLVTTYNHMQSIAKHGGWVSKGEVIGYEGTTGLSTGCHLHFETRENGTPVNPLSWF